MIDLENLIFTKVAQALRSAHTGVAVKGEYTPVQDSFPSVTIEMKECAVDKNFRSSSGIENLTRTMFEVNVYSNKEHGRKDEAKKIMQTADGKFAELGFTRTMYSPIPNLQDSTIYRLTARYEASIGEDENTANGFIIYNN